MVVYPHVLPKKIEYSNSIVIKVEPKKLYYFNEMKGALASYYCSLYFVKRLCAIIIFSFCLFCCLSSKKIEYLGSFVIKVEPKKLFYLFSIFHFFTDYGFITFLADTYDRIT